MDSPLKIFVNSLNTYEGGIVRRFRIPIRQRIIKNPLTKGFIQGDLYEYGSIRFIRDITIEIFRADRKCLCAERRWFYEHFGLIKIIPPVLLM